jgi:hypothetical protein
MILLKKYRPMRKFYMPDKHQIASEWFGKGEHDITGARILFESKHFTDTIAMLIQQTIEKY